MAARTNVTDGVRRTARLGSGAIPGQLLAGVLVFVVLAFGPDGRPRARIDAVGDHVVGRNGSVRDVLTYQGLVIAVREGGEPHPFSVYERW
ncbi:hypothetical protein ABZ318_27505 [Streptomyces sp. NPDC006197]|uniref:hypothetical protein n=1 Tax=Streptomyces sp. NPDC006197 TaxID=3156685 RepID=UPI00339E1637